MQRVAMICFHSCPLAAPGYEESGGMNVYVRELSKKLAGRGLMVDVYTRRKSSSLPGVVEFAEGCRVIHVRAGPSSPISKNLLWLYLNEFARGVFHYAASQDISYDIIHSHYWLSGLVALGLREIWDLPIVHMFHTLGRAKNSAARGAMGKESEKRIRGEAEVLSEADVVVASSNVEKSQMKGLYGARADKIRVVPCGVDLNLFRPMEDAAARRIAGLDGSKVVLFVGRIDPIKGIDSLIKALAFLKLREPDLSKRLKLMIVGGGSSEEDPESLRLKKIASRLGAENSIIFAGPREQYLLPAYYCAAEVTVLPSRYESFGMVALEAMACGSPVIATDVGGLPSIVKDGLTGYIVAGDDWRALAGKIALVMRDEKLRQRLGAAGIAVAKNFNWNFIADNIGRIYISAVEGNGDRPNRKRLSLDGSSIKN